ncbi:MAG: outer membrane beta-barrel protein [Planctomycetaceae bacterium]
MMAVVTTAMAVAVLATATPAAGQLRDMPQLPERHFIRVGFGGGISVPTANAADALDNGINGQAFLVIDPGLGFPIRLNLGYQKFDWKEAVLSGVTGGESQVLSGVAGLTFDLIRLGPVRPYVMAGLGAFNLKETLEGTATGGSTSTTNFGIDGGAGIALKIGRLEAFIEGRLQNVYTQDGVIDSNTIRAVPVTFGILF